jgi:hypothetical protein
MSISGASYTIHMTREASNSTTATNYALEGEIRDKPSVPAIPGKAGSEGPWLELIPDRHTNVPNTILTKTHCAGYCIGPRCRNAHTKHSFMVGCLTGSKAVETEEGVSEIQLAYDRSLVKKSIHLIRHPLDNIVSRFNLEYNRKVEEGNKVFLEAFPKNQDGFRRWCAVSDQDQRLFQTSSVDETLCDAMRRIPCFNDFFRYVQWHNLAFSVTRDMNIPTMLVHYEEYSTDIERARDRVLSFLELPRNGELIEFQPGKVYRSYYSAEQRRDIRAFIQEFASVKTWAQLKDYDFESEASPVAIE